MKRYWMQVALSLVTGFLLFACSSSTDTSFFINVGIQNSTDATLDVTIQTSGNVAGLLSDSFAPGYTSTEINGTSGSIVLFTATGPGGLSGLGSCTATNAIVGTDTYGQVNLIVGITTDITVECASGWLESP